MESSQTLSYDPKLNPKTHSRNTFFNHLFRLKKVSREINVEICDFRIFVKLFATSNSLIHFEKFI